MKKERFYFAYFIEKDIAFGIKLSLYPFLSLHFIIPFIEIRMGIDMRINNNQYQGYPFEACPECGEPLSHMDFDLQTCSQCNWDCWK